MAAMRSALPLLLLLLVVAGVANVGATVSLTPGSHPASQAATLVAQGVDAANFPLPRGIVLAFAGNVSNVRKQQSIASTDGQSFSAVVNIEAAGDSGIMADHPSIATFKPSGSATTSIYATYILTTGAIRVAVGNTLGTAWSGHITLPSTLPLAQKRPQLIQFGTFLYAIYPDLATGAIRVLRSSSPLTASSWALASTLPAPTVTFSTVGAAVFGNALYIGWRLGSSTTAGQLRLASTTTGTTWSAPLTIGTETSLKGPALASFKGQLYVSYVTDVLPSLLYYKSSATPATATSWAAGTALNTVDTSGNHLQTITVPALKPGAFELRLVFNDANGPNRISQATVY